MKKYLYADESGNMDFRDHSQFANGPTRYFAMGTLVLDGEDAMKALRADLTSLRYDVMRSRPAFDGYFHASEDKQQVRDAVFGVLQKHDFKVDVTLIEKSKAQPHIRKDAATFYQYAWCYHFKWLAPRYFGPQDDVMLVNASYGTKKLRKNFRAGVESVIEQCCTHVPKKSVGFWDSQTDVLLQAADYATWAVARQYERGDNRSRILIEDKISSVYDLWAVGRTHYYGPLARHEGDA